MAKFKSSDDQAFARLIESITAESDPECPCTISCETADANEI